jgi:glycosyltransferase involved in cell wall biosynthesis
VERTRDAFEICVVANLRPVKDPLLAARAARLLPARSRLRVAHVGAGLDLELLRAAQQEAAGNPRYRWLGQLRHRETLRTIAASQALVVTSLAEGGANVVSEAIANGTRVLSTRIDGSVGLLGAAYPGYFPAGDPAALAALLLRLEEDEGFRRELDEACAALRPLFEVDRERKAWANLLSELIDAREGERA